MGILENTTVFAVVALVVAFVAIAGIIVKRYKIAGPSEAFIVAGRKGKPVTNPETGIISTDLSGQKVVMGSGVFVLPFVQKAYTISLSSRRIPIRITGAVSKAGIRLNLEGVAIVKVGGSEDAIRAAAQRFLHQQDEIESFTQEVLAGSLRSIVGGLTVDEIIRDRAAFAAKVAEESESSLTGQGLVLDTFQIQDVTDDGEYLRDMGRPEAAFAKQKADIAEAEARRASEEARLKTEEQVAVANRELALRKASIRQETDAAEASAAASGPLATAAREQEVLVEEEKVAQRRASVTERQLEIDVRKPADAERYRVTQEAEGRRDAAIAEAEADKAAAIAAAEAKAQAQRLGAASEAEAARLSGEGELERRRAIAEAVRAEGEAEADAIRAKGLAEAEAMQSKADALKEYGDAAITQMVVEALPLVAREIAAPMSNIKDLRIISTDGATELSKTVTNNLTQTMEMVKTATGIDVGALLSGFSGARLGSVEQPVAAVKPVVVSPPVKKAPATTEVKPGKV